MDTPAEGAAAAPPRGRRRQVEEEEVTESKRLGMWKTHLLGQSPWPNVPLQRARPAPRVPQPSAGLGKAADFLGLASHGAVCAPRSHTSQTPSPA